MPPPYSNFKDGTFTLAAAGTRQALASPTPCGKVFITGGENNQGTLVIGGKTVVAAVNTRSGSGLAALQPMTIEIDDLSKVMIDGTVTGDTLTYSYLL
jgi:hypothetical protein